MKLTTAATTTMTTKTGTITVADIRKKFRIPDSATLTLIARDAGDGMETLPTTLAIDDVVLTVTHVVEAAK